MPSGDSYEDPEKVGADKEKEIRIILDSAQYSYSRPPQEHWYKPPPPPDDNWTFEPGSDTQVWEDYVADSWRRVHGDNERLQRLVNSLTREKETEMSQRLEAESALRHLREQFSAIESQLMKEKQDAVDELRHVQNVLGQERSSRSQAIEDAVDNESLRLNRDAEDLRRRLGQSTRETEELREACAGLRNSLEKQQVETQNWFQDCRAWEDQCKEWGKEREQMRAELGKMTRICKESEERQMRTERELERLQTEAQDSQLEFARLKEDSSRHQELRLEVEKSQASATEELKKISLNWEQVSAENEYLREETAMLGAKLRNLEEAAARQRMDLVREEQANARLREEKDELEQSCNSTINELRSKKDALALEYNELEQTISPMKARQHGLICETSQLRACNNLLRRELDACRAENYELKVPYESHDPVSRASRNSQAERKYSDENGTATGLPRFHDSPLGNNAWSRLGEEPRRSVSASAPHHPMTIGDDCTWHRGADSAGIRSRLNGERFKFNHDTPNGSNKTERESRIVPYKSYTVNSPTRPRSAAR